MTEIHSSRLQFTRDGCGVVVAESDRVVIVDVKTGRARHEVAIEGVETIAAFADQLWTATGDGALRRWTLDGQALDDGGVNLDVGGTLVPTTVGSPAALWTSDRPTLFLDDLGRLSSTPADRDAIPVAGRRLARVAASKLILPSGTSIALEGVERILGGGAILDGTSLALVTRHTGGRDIHVVAIASGRVLQRTALPPGVLRLASRRGVAVVQNGLDLALFDLRLGRSLGTVVADCGVADVAIDPDATQLALRALTGEIELVPLIGAARARRARTERYAPANQEELGAAVLLPLAMASEAPIADVEPAPPIPIAVENDIPPTSTASAIAAFEPRRNHATPPRGDALTALDQRIRSVRLRAVRAIAAAWNTRRLGYGDEGAHPFEHEVAALAGSNSGFATDYLAVSQRAVSDHAAELAASRSTEGLTPIDALVEEFGLSVLAVDMLLVIAAPAIDGNIARLYSILANDPSRSVVDELLVEHVLDANNHEIATELHAHSPLLRFGLVHPRTSRARPFTSLEVDPVVLARLRCETPHLGAAVATRVADRELADLDVAPGVLASALDALTRTPRPARLAVRGRAGTGRRTLLASLAAQARRALGVIDATVLPREAARFAEALRDALRRVQLAGMFPVVHGLEDVVLGEQTGTDLARDVLSMHPGAVVVTCPHTTNPPFTGRCAVIDLPMISETRRLDVWQRALSGAGRWARDPSSLAARYRVGPGVIRRAVTAVAADDTGIPCDDALETYLRESRGHVLGQHASRVERLATWNDLVLPLDIMDSLRELVGRVRHRRTVFEDWGMGDKMATSRGLTALFQGQPGTGKTLVAGVIARELGLDLYQVDLSKVMSKWIGETERNLSKIFDAADDGQAILLFDEADSLFARRTEVRSSNDRYANLEVNYLLQRLDSFDGFAILTTNSGGSIDPAFKRRLSFQLSFPFPDEETRASLWRAHLPPKLPRATELTFDALARKYQLSGGYIRNACLRAAFLAAQEEKPLQQEHLERAIALEFAEQGKLSTTGSIA
ncbi:MAG: ATP-binding protein [Deltaproteobacteria bacterium]|nr:ATP-binding protein [Deltaproteobacteria bacterium]